MKILKPKFWDKNKGYLSFFLLPLTLVTILIIFLKKKLIKSIKFKISVICVGNIYVGGTGKTPFAIFLANNLLKIKKRPVIIRKFYKSHEDEYRLIKEHFNQLITANNRIEAIKKAEVSNFDTVILDDGFQDYSIKKKLNIVCFNQNQLIGNGFILPAGPLRDSLQSLVEANIIIINGEKDLEFEKKILEINHNLDIFYSYYKPINIDQFKGKEILAIAGIGNPENFFRLVENNGLVIKKKIVYPDHYNFTEKEIENILSLAKEKNYQILMTEKDYYKIRDFNKSNFQYLKLTLEIEKKEKLLNRIKEIYD